MEAERAAYWRRYSEELAEQLTANDRIVSFTQNSAVIGAFAEASIIQLVRRMVAPYRCSTGSIISSGDSSGTESLKQLDLILWMPSPYPAIFESGDFALVPAESVLGVVEVKRSLYNKVGTNLRSTLDWVEARCEGVPQPAAIAHELILNSQPEASRYLDREDWKPDPFHLALGVVCLRSAHQRDAEFEALVEEGRAVCLQTRSDDHLDPIPSHLMHLVEFLRQVKIRADRKLRLDAAFLAPLVDGSQRDQPPGSLRRNS